MNAPKLKKIEVHYRRATTERRCGACSMFRSAPLLPSGGACTLVAGSIWYTDTCDRFEWKKKAA